MQPTSVYHEQLMNRTVNVNPFFLFALLFAAPYLLFYLLLAAVTGESDPSLLIFTLIDMSGSVYFKAWFIGYLLLSVLSALLLSAEGTRRRLAGQFRNKNRTPSPAYEPAAHYSIEVLPDKTIEQDERYGRLGRALACDA